MCGEGRKGGEEQGWRHGTTQQRSWGKRQVGVGARGCCWSHRAGKWQQGKVYAAIAACLSPVRPVRSCPVAHVPEACQRGPARCEGCLSRMQNHVGEGRAEARLTSPIYTPVETHKPKQRRREGGGGRECFQHTTLPGCGNRRGSSCFPVSHCSSM